MTPARDASAGDARVASIRDDLQRRTAVVGHLPYYYHVHLHMPCNQRCIMCVPSGHHPSASLPYEDFLALFESIRPHAEHITLIGGETLLYPRIVDVLSLLARHPLAVTINTNATLFEPPVVEALNGLHELHLKCSIDAAHRALYHRIRGTDVFDRVVDNIRAFARGAARRPGIKVILVYVVMKENLDDVVPFIELFADEAIERIEFHPVRHVGDWVVENRTGWTFRGAEQVCEAVAGEYNTVIARARERARELGVPIETHPMPGA